MLGGAITGGLGGNGSFACGSAALAAGLASFALPGGMKAGIPGGLRNGGSDGLGVVGGDGGLGAGADDDEPSVGATVGYLSGFSTSSPFHCECPYI